MAPLAIVDDVAITHRLTTVCSIAARSTSLYQQSERKVEARSPTCSMDSFVIDVLLAQLGRR